MSLELALIGGFLCHLIGDYLLQNDWMALNKKNDSFPCFIHCFLYILPFYVLLGSGYYLWIVFITHYLIDRYHFVDWFLAYRNGINHIQNFGFSDERPPLLALFLYIVTDNTFHIIFNSIAIFLKVYGII